jgi:hypothetical protein
VVTISVIVDAPPMTFARRCGAGLAGGATASARTGRLLLLLRARPRGTFVITQQANRAGRISKVLPDGHEPIPQRLADVVSLMSWALATCSSAISCLVRVAAYWLESEI